MARFSDRNPGGYRMGQVNSYGESRASERTFGPMRARRGEQPAVKYGGIPGLLRADSSAERVSPEGVLAEGGEPVRGLQDGLRSGPRAGRQHQRRGAPRPRHRRYDSRSRPPLVPSRPRSTSYALADAGAIPDTGVQSLAQSGCAGHGRQAAAGGRLASATFLSEAGISSRLCRRPRASAAGAWWLVPWAAANLTNEPRKK